MYFIFEMAFASDKPYMAELIRAYAQEININIDVVHSLSKITLIAKREDEKLELFLKGLEERLPASVFLGQSRHYFSEEKPYLEPRTTIQRPHNISLCPSCQKEMFDVSSPRYYYPFTSCNACGTQHPFVTAYPYERRNSSMKFLVPCASCQEELRSNPLRKEYPLISCIECGITLKMNDGKSERYANDKGSFRKLFEVSAAAIAKGKRLLMKTPNGYRRFFKPTTDSKAVDTILLITDAKALNTHMMMVTQEFNALLSIERPIVRISTKSEEMKAIYGSTALVKYPDDGMTMLLARELLNLGITYVAYEVCDASCEADYLVDFDIPVEPQPDAKLFINQDTHFFIGGQRGIFPVVVEGERSVVSIAHGLAAIPHQGAMLIDTMERFDSLQTSRVNLLEGEPFESGHSNEYRFEPFKGAMLSVLAEHGKIGQKAIGIHFDKALYFLYYNAKEVINVVPPNPFEADSMFEHIASLREGSDRLVENYKKHYPKVYERLSKLQGGVDLFSVTAMMLELEEENFEGISAEALSFLGKGGIQIDTRVEDNRFDNYAFLASIMSYLVAGVERNLICYSIYESFGDYIAEVSSQLIAKTKTKLVTLTGETLANQALYARIERHMGMRELLFPQQFPIGEECEVHGGIYL